MTDQTSAQLDRIWSAIQSAVEAEVARTGHCPPFGATLDRADTVEAVIPAGKVADADALRAQLRDKAASGRYAAIGQVGSVTAAVGEAAAPVTGVLFQFDNDAGVSQATFLPYQVSDGQISYGQLHGQEGDHAVFPPSG